MSGIKHAFISAVADDGDSSKVQPSNWNADHVIDGPIIVPTGGSFVWNGQGSFKAEADGIVSLRDNAGTSFGLLQFGGTTSSFPALERSGSVLAVKLADNSARAVLAASTFYIGADNGTMITELGGLRLDSGSAARPITFFINGTQVASVTTGGALVSNAATAGIGYATGAGGTVAQVTSRTTGVTIDKVCGQITLVSAAGSATYASFTVTNSAVAATDEPRVWQVSGTDLYEIHITAVAAGSFQITFRTTGGTTTETPVFGFAIRKAVTT